MSWRKHLLEIAARAPEWMRERASADLEVAVIEARLDTPVLDVDGLDEDAADRAVAFFLCAALASGVRVARVRCGGRPSRDLARRTKRSLGRVIVRLDDENAALMGYFDAHLRDPAAIDERAVASLARRLRSAIEGAERSSDGG